MAGRVTERDCATDGDMESQGRREQEWGGCGRGRRAGAGRGERRQVRGGGGRSQTLLPRRFGHPRWPWLPQEGWRGERGPQGSRTPPRPRWHMSPRATAGSRGQAGEGLGNVGRAGSTGEHWAGSPRSSQRKTRWGQQS